MPESTTTPTTQPAAIVPEDLVLESFPVPSGSGPHDVAPALDGGVWYTAQDTGELGWLDPATGETRHTALGEGSAPHGVIIDEAGTAWVTDGGLNAIVAVDPVSLEVTVYPLPDGRPDANLNTASFDGDGMLWFTGQNGIYGCVDPDTGELIVFDAPEGPGPYGVTPPLMASSITPPSPALISLGSRATGLPPSSSRPHRTRERDGFGPIPRGKYGSVSGIQGI